MGNRLPPMQGIQNDDDEEVQIVDSGEEGAEIKKGLGMSGSLGNINQGISTGEKDTETQYGRAPDPDRKTAIRCHTFHAKLNDGALHFLDEQINHWLEKHGYEVKFSQMTMGPFQGKSVEQHLIVQVWY